MNQDTTTAPGCKSCKLFFIITLYPKIIIILNAESMTDATFPLFPCGAYKVGLDKCEVPDDALVHRTLCSRDSFT
jgi:hypothetical protein